MCRDPDSPWMGTGPWWPVPTKLTTMGEARTDHPRAPAPVIQSLFGPWFLLLSVLHVGTGNVFDSRRKPSVSPLENYPLELTQPRSCTRR